MTCDKCGKEIEFCDAVYVCDECGARFCNKCASVSEVCKECRRGGLKRG